jgi:hypothetical protein
MKNSCLEQMRPAVVGSRIGLDRLATWDEVRCAMSQGSFELVGNRDDFRGVASDFSGRACNLPDDTTWFAIANKVPDSMSN